MSVVFIRTIVIFIIVVTALRIMGKRQLGELQPSELVVTILVSNLATMSIEDSNIPLLGMVIPIFTLVSCEVLISFIILKSAAAQKIIDGNPRIVIRDGIIDQKEIKNLRWTVEDLLEQLRVNKIFDPDEVALAIAETSGKLSIFEKYSHRAMTLDIQDNRAGEDCPPLTLISDGKVVKDTMSYCNVDHKWLGDTLKGENLTLKQVFLMTCDRNKAYKITKKEI